MRLKITGYPDKEIVDEKGRVIANWYTGNISVEDANHILKCVNMHDELVKELKWKTELLKKYEED